MRTALSSGKPMTLAELDAAARDPDLAEAARTELLQSGHAEYLGYGLVLGSISGRRANPMAWRDAAVALLPADGSPASPKEIAARIGRGAGFEPLLAGLEKAVSTGLAMKSGGAYRRPTAADPAPPHQESTPAANRGPRHAVGPRAVDRLRTLLSDGRAWSVRDVGKELGYRPGYTNVLLSAAVAKGDAARLAKGWYAAAGTEASARADLASRHPEVAAPGDDGAPSAPQEPVTGGGTAGGETAGQAAPVRDGTADEAAPAPMQTSKAKPKDAAAWRRALGKAANGAAPNPKAAPRQVARPPSGQATSRGAGRAAWAVVADAMADRATHDVPDLSRRTGLSTSAVSACLDLLVTRGEVARIRGGSFRRQR